MPDRNGTIKRLQDSLKVMNRWCRTDSLDDPISNMELAIEDALELLKEKEPMPCGEKIKAGDVMLDFYECGYCKNAIRKPWKYCPFCDKAVKWNG